MRISFGVWLALCARAAAPPLSPAAVARRWREDGAPQPAVLDLDARLLPAVREGVLAHIGRFAAFSAFLVLCDSLPAKYVAADRSVDLRAFNRDLGAELALHAALRRKPLIVTFALAHNAYLVSGADLSSAALARVFAPAKPAFARRDYNAALPLFVGRLGAELAALSAPPPPRAQGPRLRAGLAMIIAAAVCGALALVAVPLLCCLGACSLCCRARRAAPPAASAPEVGGTWVEEEGRGGQW